MAVDVNGIREALAAKIKASIDREIAVYDGYIPPVPKAPCILVKPDADFQTFEKTFNRPNVECRFELWMLTDPGMGVDGQKLLGQFMSCGTGQGNSVYDALQASPNLGGLGTVVVTGSEYRDTLLLGAPESQVPFDFAIVRVTVTQSG